MKNPNQNEAETDGMKYEKSFGSTEDAEINEGTSMAIRDADTVLSMIVLLVACLGLAVLAHVFV
jgi:hypothetical protein